MAAEEQDSDLFGEPSGENPGDSSVINDLRKQLREAQKARKEEQKELEGLRSFVQETRTKELTARTQEAFTRVGLPDKLAGLFLKTNPDVEPEAISEETVRAFASEYGLAPEPATPVNAEQIASEESKPFQAPPTTEFTPVTGGSAPFEPVTSAELTEAAKRGDLAKLQEAAAREVQQPGYIKFRYPHLLGED